MAKPARCPLLVNLAPPLLLVIVLLAIGCLDQKGPLKDVYTGQDARNRIVGLVKLPSHSDKESPLPQSATNYYLFDGGSFNGSITYWSFDCASHEDCWAAIASLGGPGRSEFHPWKPSRFAVVMNGPGFYQPQLATPLWDVTTIQHGAVYEDVDGDKCMDYYAIDYDTLRVYHHHESGGFPTTTYTAPGNP
jgi:hypothetical protein